MAELGYQLAMLITHKHPDAWADDSLLKKERIFTRILCGQNRTKCCFVLGVGY
jgi:hypothetical protein